MHGRVNDLRRDPASLRRRIPLASTIPLRGYQRRVATENSRWYVGHLFSFLATGADNDDQFSLIESIVRRGLEPPPHIHSREDETYYVLEGRATFMIGGETVTAGPGDFVYLPRHVPHGFRLETETARFLIQILPADLEQVFFASSEPAESATLPPPPAGPPDIEKMVRVFGEYGVEFLPPS
jgi:quercetin dioxygenase-like cupin family protein